MSGQVLIPLPVAQKNWLTDDCVALTLDVPEQLRSVFDYRPGQYLTLEFTIDGQTVRRAYSLCSSPRLDKQLQIGVKRIDDGLVSRHIHGTLQAGDTVQVLPPDGQFHVDTDPKARRSYYLFAAGSGITPVYSIARTVLASEPYSHVYLLYGSRDEEHIIFGEQLEQLQAEHPGHFMVQHQLSQPLSHKWSSLLSSREYWKGATGRIDAKAIEQFILDHPPQAQEAIYCVCGPGAMIEQTEATLRSLDVADEHIKIEHFGDANSRDGNINGQKATAVAHYAGETLHANITAEQTLLEGFQAAGHTLPNSCQSGVCGQCVAQLKSGDVAMRSHMALDDEDLKAGKILCCQAVAKSNEIEISI